jgi:uncharacterized protein
MKKDSVKLFFQKRIGSVNGYRVLVGYKGFGAVGVITIHHIIGKLGMTRVGLFVTKAQPEYVFRDDGDLHYPFELYYSEEYKLLALLSREIPEKDVRMDFTNFFTKFVKERGAGPIYLIGGLDSRFKVDDKSNLRWTANKYYLEGGFPKPSEPEIEEGLMIVGPLALHFLYSEIMGVPALVILPYARTDTPDPYAASIAVEALNNLIGTSITSEELVQEAKIIEEELKRIEQSLPTSQPGGGEPYM